MLSKMGYNIRQIEEMNTQSGNTRWISPRACFNAQCGACFDDSRVTQNINFQPIAKN